MNKKALELPINLIIVIAIGLAILVFFFVVFTSNAGQFSKATQSCEIKGGKCVVKGGCQTQKTDWVCPKETPECCYNSFG